MHQTKMATDATEWALQLLRDQIGQPVYPTHRLDRKTAGVLLFALNQEMNGRMQQLFADRKVGKVYHCIVRGFIPDLGTIDYELIRDDGKRQPAITHYKTLKQFEIDVPFGKYATSRYSLVEVKPETGRMHQIRKHMKHIFHPIVGDRPHGCNKQNKLFLEKWGMSTMMLHAKELVFVHPVSGEEVIIDAGCSEEFERVLGILG